MLGVVTALTTEGDCLISGTKVALRPTVVTPYNGMDAVIVSGIGPVNARNAALTLIANGATALLSWGTAGGLSPHCLPGTLVIPQTITDGQKHFVIDKQWHSRLLQRLNNKLTVDMSTIVSTPTVVSTPRQKQALWQATAATAVDMESASIAEVADTSGIPFLAVRAIVDPATFTLPDAVIESTDMFGRPQWPKMAMNLLRNPSTVVKLVQLAKFFHEATTSLRTVADLTGRVLR